MNSKDLKRLIGSFGMDLWIIYSYHINLIRQRHKKWIYNGIYLYLTTIGSNNVNLHKISTFPPIICIIYDLWLPFKNFEEFFSAWKVINLWVHMHCIISSSKVMVALWASRSSTWCTDCVKKFCSLIVWS
jgi:hypothetical protein